MHEWDSHSQAVKVQVYVVYVQMEALGTIHAMVILTGVTTGRRHKAGNRRQQVKTTNDTTTMTDDTTRADYRRDDHSRTLVNIVVGAITFLQHANLRMRSATNVINMVISLGCIARTLGNRDSRLSLRLLGMGTNGEIMQTLHPSLRFVLVRPINWGKIRI